MLISVFFSWYVFYRSSTSSAKSRNITHAVCDFEWFNYISGNYNLSLTIIYNNQSDMKINPSIPVYYYNCSHLTVINVSPNEVLLDDLPSYVTLTGSGFFDWAGSETICFIGSQSTMDVMYVNSTNLKCKVSSYKYVFLFHGFGQEAFSSV